ncbi:Hypothetical protein D9617_3g020430 [Elsinoe fawcettii]|nr:Hypothetical protein D9617_3g020430 [Elsinoe fawcettii]
MTENSGLFQKYQHEREKRLRADGMAQYTALNTAALADIARDPWIDYHHLARSKPTLQHDDNIKFLVVGAGHAGLLLASRIILAGFTPEQICVVDVAGGVGGTWYWNRYPGLMCDVEGYCYLPLLEETGYVPKHRYSYGQEIRGQSERIVEKLGIRTQLSTRVRHQTWNEATCTWDVEMEQSLGPVTRPRVFTVHAQCVIPTGGVLSIPKIPKMSGFDEMRKNVHVFHTSRWDYNFTGGCQENPEMTGLTDKVVAIVGTGATAIQVVPELARWAKHVYVIQWTPSYCGERGQRLTDDKMWKVVAHGPGWQNHRRLNFNRMVSNDPDTVDLVSDGWTATPGGAGLLGNPEVIARDRVQEHIDQMLSLDADLTNRVRDHIAKVVSNPAVATKLQPWYPSWCKRPAFHDDYLAAFNRPNVTLVDTDGRGIEQYTSHGVIAGGMNLHLDALVMATGFYAVIGNAPSNQQGAPIIGRGGRSIKDKWDANDFGTLLGLATHGFPNMFLTGIRGGSSSYNLTSTYDVAARAIASILKAAHDRAEDPDKLIIEVFKAAEDDYTDRVAERAAWYSLLSVCTPGYFTSEGEAFKAVESAEEAAQKARRAGWGGGPVEWQHMLEDRVSKGLDSLEGFGIRAPLASN